MFQSRNNLKSLSLFLLLLFPFIINSTFIKNDNVKERFNISNYTVFSPASEVSVSLYSNIRQDAEYKFRLLKIVDPIEFFSKIDRQELRINFDIWSIEKENLLKYTKIVKEWNSTINGSYITGSNKNVDVGKIDEPGIYILQASRNNLVAYCGITVSKYAMVYKNNGSEVLAYIADAESGNFVSDVKFNLYKDNKLLESKLSDKQGLVYFKLNDKLDFSDRNALLIGQTGDETVLSDPYFYFRLNNNNYTVYVYTNQPVYRPGQTVNFKAIVRKQDSNELINVNKQDFNVKVTSPKNKEVYSGVLTSDDFGSIYDSLKLDEDADLGNYSIKISKDDQTYYGSFSVEEYKKPEYEVNVNPSGNQFAYGDTIQAKVNAKYYFGSPLTTGNVQIKLYRQSYWRPWWYWSDYSWFYRSFDTDKIHGYGRKELVYSTEGKLNQDGTYDFEYKVDKELDADYTYIIEAQVQDNSRMTISGSASVYVTRGSFTISTSPERSFVPVGTPINLRVNAYDFNDNPVKTSYTLVVHYPTDNRKDRMPTYANDTLRGKTDELGKSLVTFLPRSFFPGRYSYTIIAKDSKGREIASTNYFYMGNVHNYSFGADRYGIDIVTDKDSYEKGDTLSAIIILPEKHTQLLVTFESGGILKYKMYNVDGNTLNIKEKLTAEYSPSFNISITYIRNRRLYTKMKQVGVLDKDNMLNISITHSKENYKPGEEAEYKVVVKDNNGNPVKNTQLSFGVVDESIYAIKADETPDIKNFFYAPKYSYIPTYTSLENNYFNGTSRYETKLDKYIDTNESPEGDGSIQGKIKVESGKVDFSKLLVILNSDKNFYRTTVDTSGNYSFKNIVHGKYDLLVYLDDGEMFLSDHVTINGSEKADINLGNYTNRIPTMPHFPRGGVVMEKSTNDVALQSASPTYFSAKESASDYVAPVLRSNFVDAVYWKPNIVTNSNGVAYVKFKMPDNLTTWRATVKGVTANTKVGQEINKVITRKNLLVRMETPRFFREGDELTISTIVHNYLSEQKKVKIIFDSGDLKLLNGQLNTPGYSTNIYSKSKNHYELTVDKNSEVRIDWKVKVDEPIGNAVLKAEALTNEESDAVQLTVPIYPKGFKNIESLTTDIENNSSTKSIKFNIPRDVDLRTAQLSFSVNPSLAGTMLKALDDLAGYPYGCVEQTMSRFLPTVIVAGTFKKLDAPLKSNTLKELPDMVDKGLKRLYNFQHSDGGWGWWTNDQTHPYMTAYVIYGMTLAKDAGFKI